MAKLLSRLTGLSGTDAARLGVWKLRRGWRHALDRAGGTRRMRREAETLAAGWFRVLETDGLAAWLSRPEAGEWWFGRDPVGWARATFTPADVALAESAARGDFALLGATSKPSVPPAWRRDLYSGAEWPLDPSSRLPIVRGDGSDVRTVWELSRCYHFLALARCHAASGESRWAEVFATHVDSFREQNPIGLGPHWASAMDVAIRAANWCVAVPLFASSDLPSKFWAELLADLQLAGRWLECHLEWHPVFRGNHYVANLVGLAYLGTLFRGTKDGDRWLRHAGEELQREIRYQVAADGVALEASLAYHRLHTELFAFAGELLRRNHEQFDALAYDGILGRMTRFMAAYLQPDGRAPVIGDADDGRLHALSAGALADPRLHAEGLPAPWTPPAVEDGAFSFPAGGFHVLRHGSHHAVIRCGAVGLRGAGSHDHNDQLGFELVVDGCRLVSDSGTYAYTRDLAARHAFRSTAAHSVVQLGGEEQNPIEPGRPWRVLADRTRARVLRCEANADALRFEAEHHGYAHRPSGAVCRRSIELDRRSGEWSIVDVIEGTGREEVAWRLHLHDVDVQLDGERAICRTAFGHTFAIDLECPPEMSLSIAMGRQSDAYGTAANRPVLAAAGTLVLPVTVRCRIRVWE